MWVLKSQKYKNICINFLKKEILLINIKFQEENVMRKELGRRKSEEKNKNIMYIGGSILAIGILAIAITYVIYGNKMEEQSKINTAKISELVQNSNFNTRNAISQYTNGENSGRI